MYVDILAQSRAYIVIVFLSENMLLMRSLLFSEHNEEYVILRGGEQTPSYVLLAFITPGSLFDFVRTYVNL